MDYSHVHVVIYLIYYQINLCIKADLNTSSLNEKGMKVQ